MINFIICLTLFSLQIYKIHIIFRVFSVASVFVKPIVHDAHTFLLYSFVRGFVHSPLCISSA